MTAPTPKPRKASTPARGAGRDGTLTGVLTTVIVGAGAYYGLDIDAREAAELAAGVGVVSGAAGGAVVGAGKSFRDFRASGRGGFLRWAFSWIY